MKRLRIFWRLVRAAWTLSELGALEQCICPDSCGAVADGPASFVDGLCSNCARNEVCLRQSLRRSRGVPH